MYPNNPGQPFPGQPPQGQPVPNPYGQPQNSSSTDLLEVLKQKVPVFPVALGVIALVCLFALIFGGYKTSTTALCTKYDTLIDTWDSSSIYVDKEMNALVKAAGNYNDADVREDAERLDNLGYTFSLSDVRERSRHIAAVCRR